MKSIAKKLQQIFSYKKNWFIFLLSFVVIFSSTLAINSKYSEVKEAETISSYFPDNLLIDNTIRYVDKTFRVENSYRGCSYFEVIEYSPRQGNPTNLDIDEKTKLSFLGVDNNFFNCQIIPDNNRYKFNKLAFPGDVSYQEDAFKNKGMFAVIPDGLIRKEEVENFKICGKDVKVIGTYSTMLENKNVMIILPNTTFLDMFSSYTNLMKVSLYVDRASGGGLTGYALSNTINKDDIIFATNATIRVANETLPLYIVLCFIASVSICILCVFAIKNRYNEIGIKLAIGASKVDVLLELVIENMVVILMSSLGAFALSILTSVTMQSIQTIKTGIYAINIHMPVIAFCLTAFLISSFFFVFLTSLIGVNSNIEGMLKEER